MHLRIALACLTVVVATIFAPASEAFAAPANVGPATVSKKKRKCHKQSQQRRVKRGHRSRKAHRVCDPGGNGKSISTRIPQLGGGYSNARIADIGLGKLNKWAGQCKQAVNDWVYAASGHQQRLGGDYVNNYKVQGGVQVGRDDASKGDIIQLSGPNPSLYYNGMHTAVVVSHSKGSNVFDVVDSNWGWDEIVRHHAWNPYASASAHGLSLRIWRMGSVDGQSQPASTTAPADLNFIKTAGAATVEAHWATASSGFQQRGGDYESDFSPTDAANGTWQLFGGANGAPQLGFVKTKNTGGTVEAHWDNRTGNSYTRVGSFTSDFSPADADNGTWQLFGSANGAPILGFIKAKNSAGTVEAHWDVLSGGSFKRAGSFTSDFSPADADNGRWMFFGSANGAPQLGFIKYKGTPGTVEVHWDNLAGGAFKRAGDFVSDFSTADALNGTWTLFGAANGAPQLGFVKTKNTAGTVEAHWDALSAGQYRRVGASRSNFGIEDAANGTWQLGSN